MSTVSSKNSSIVGVLSTVSNNAFFLPGKYMLLSFLISFMTLFIGDIVEKQNTSYEFKSTSYEFKFTSYEFKSTS